VFVSWQLTPDRNFIIDSHPKWKNIIIAAGFSGKWIFKFQFSLFQTGMYVTPTE